MIVNEVTSRKIQNFLWHCVCPFTNRVKMKAVPCKPVLDFVIPDPAFLVKIAIPDKIAFNPVSDNLIAFMVDNQIVFVVLVKLYFHDTFPFLSLFTSNL